MHLGGVSGVPRWSWGGSLGSPGGSQGSPCPPQPLSRALVNVGAKLTHPRDVRDFFVDLVEKVRDDWAGLGANWDQLGAN